MTDIQRFQYNLFLLSFTMKYRHASRMLFQIFYKATKVFQQAPDEFALNMDMPEI